MASSKKEMEQKAIGAAVISVVVAFVLSKILGVGFWVGTGIAVIVFLIFAYFVDKEEEELAEHESGKDCPYCGERIKQAAIKCKHCQSSL